MHYKENSISKKLLCIILICIQLILTIAIVNAANTDESILEPSDDQYFELRATNVKQVPGQNKQVIMELWGYNIEFKAFDVRFCYDGDKYTPSNIETNTITTDETEYFKFEDEFVDSLELFDIGYTGDGFRWVTSFNPPVTESEHIIEKEGIGKVVSTQGGVLLGKMSFQMTVDEFDVSGFSLVEGTTSPTTGIKINIDATNSYQNKKVFRFTDKTASKDANLSNLIVSSGTIDETDEENSTYKEYTLTPTFDKDTLNYEITLLEYIDKINIKAIQSDSKATMKIKVPKRDEDNNLQYEVDGITIVYEEKEITNEDLTEVTINELGKEDTKITIIVTAEDTKTVKEYNLTIKRPYGIVKGSIKLGETLREKAQISNGIYVEYIADIKAYKSGEFIWEDILTETTNYSVLDAMPILNQVQSDKDDGCFELFLIPGTYDVFMEKLGFTQVVNKQIMINKNDVIDLGENILHEGDVNRDGIVDITDLTTIVRQNGEDSSDPSGSYSEKYDFQKKGYIDITDITSVSSSLKKRKELVINNLGNI